MTTIDTAGNIIIPACDSINTIPRYAMPKKLPDVIECCAKCPYYNKSIHCCTHKGTLINEILDPFGVLPVWCPLEDVK